MPSEDTNEAQGESQEEAVPEAASPDEITPVEDGEAFIREMQDAGLPPLQKRVVCGREYNFRTPTGHEVPEIFRGQWRKSLEKTDQMEFDALSTAERVMVVTIQKCVVKSNRQPLWTESQILHMFSGPKAEVFSRIVYGLYQACLEVNDFLDVRNQPQATAFLSRWL